jgi:hypothetical protein
MGVALFFKQTRRRFAQIFADQKSDRDYLRSSAANVCCQRRYQRFVVTIELGAVVSLQP